MPLPRDADTDSRPRFRPGLRPRFRARPAREASAAVRGLRPPRAAGGEDPR